jgi:hypothetical protein
MQITNKIHIPNKLKVSSIVGETKDCEFKFQQHVYKIKATITTKKALEYKPMRWTNCVKSKEGVENQLKRFRTRQRRVM